MPMRETWAFTKALLFRPRKASDRLQENGAALRSSAILYSLFLLASVIFYTLKPFDFPPIEDGMGDIGEPHGWLFWTKVQLWSPLLSAAWVMFLGWFSGFFQLSASRRPWMLLSASALSLLPLVFILLYSNHFISKPLFFVSWIIILAAMTPLLRKRSWKRWQSLTSLGLCVNVVNLALCIPFSVAVVARAALAYHFLELVLLFWTLGLGAYLLSRIDGLSTSRAFAALFLSLLCQVWFVFSLYFIGIVPKEILKALMSV